MVLIMFGMLGCFVVGGGCVVLDLKIWPQEGWLAVTGVIAWYTFGCFFGSAAEKKYKEIIKE